MFGVVAAEPVFERERGSDGTRIGETPGGSSQKRTPVLATTDPTATVLRSPPDYASGQPSFKDHVLKDSIPEISSSRLASESGRVRCSTRHHQVHGPVERRTRGGDQ